MLGKYAESKVKEWQEMELKRSLEISRKAHHFESMDRTGNVTLKSLLPVVGNQVKKHLKLDLTVDQIKSGEIDKVAGWQKLKILAFSQMLSHIHCICVLAISVRVQLSILGGLMYQETIGPSTESKLSQQVQEAFLSQSQVFINEKLEELLDYIQEVTGKVTGKLKLNEKVTILSLEQILQDINNEICNNPTSPLEHISTLLISQSHRKDFSEEDQKTLDKLNRDFQEVLELGDFHKVTFSSCNHLMTMIFDHLASEFSEESQKSDFVSTMEISLPLAKVIPMMNEFMSKDQERYRALVCLTANDDMRKFSANVYESFCQFETTTKNTTDDIEEWNLQKVWQNLFST